MSDREYTNESIQKVKILSFTPSNALQAYKHLAQLPNLRSVQVSVRNGLKPGREVDAAVLARKLSPVMVAMWTAQHDEERVIDAFKLENTAYRCYFAPDTPHWNGEQCADCESWLEEYSEKFRGVARRKLRVHILKTANAEKKLAKLTAAAE